MSEGISSYDVREIIHAIEAVGGAGIDITPLVEAVGSADGELMRMREDHKTLVDELCGPDGALNRIAKALEQIVTHAQELAIDTAVIARANVKAVGGLDGGE